MKIVETHDLILRGKTPKSPEWNSACDQVRQAVVSTDWPHGTGKFTIYPESGKERGKGNGVDLIKKPCIRTLRELGWETERLPPIQAGTLTTGDLDALLRTKIGYIGFEWETGNISSSHRAINKLLLTLKLGGITGGFLVVPSNKPKVYLTDRIGNIGELRPYFGSSVFWCEHPGICGPSYWARAVFPGIRTYPRKIPYFPLWEDTRIRKGALQIIVVEHDATSSEVPRIPKRTDGRALS